MRVLIVVDHEMVCNIVAEIVGMLGADVETASNGRDALEVFRSSRLDLLITDLNMPIMDSASLIRQVRQEASHLPSCSSAATRKRCRTTSFCWSASFCCGNR